MKNLNNYLMKYNKSIAFTGLCCMLIFLGITILMHFLRLDKNPMVNYVSEYAVGNYGGIMTVGFFLWQLPRYVYLQDYCSS
ncbi:hypothetical protein BH11BAC4_BH11BAC4_23240 [soil metagenome]